MENEELFPAPEPSVDLFDSSVAGTQPVKDVPSNIDEQAIIIAAADDSVDGDDQAFGEAVADTTEKLKEGRLYELHQPILEDERVTYARAAGDMAKSAASLGNLQGAQDAINAQRAIEEQNNARKGQPDSKTASHAVVSGRALERGAAKDAYNVDSQPHEVFAQDMEEYTKYSAFRNFISTIKGDIGEPSPSEVARSVGAQLIEFANPASFSASARRAITTATGKDPGTLWTVKQIRNAVKKAFASSDNDAKEILRIELASEDYSAGYAKGEGTNRATAQGAMDALLNMTDQESSALFAFDVVALGLDVSTLGLTSLVRTIAKGAPLIAMAKTMGRKVTGQELANGIAHGKPSAFGLNDADSVGKAIAAGDHPYSLVPSHTGLSAEANARLKTMWDQMLASEKDRLSSAGLRPEETAEALERLHNTYNPETNKSVFGIQMPDGPGAKANEFVVLRTDEVGREFLSPEAAAAFARRQGIPDDAWVLTTKEAEETARLGEVRDMQAYHGGQDFDRFRKEYIGSGHGGDSLGHGFGAGTVQEMAEQYARGRGRKGDAALYELNLPESKNFMDFDKSFAKQSVEVKSALGKVLTPEELSALKNKTGREVYNTLADRLGGKQMASEKLDLAGIAGNKSGKEFLVFNEDVMNKSLVKKTKRPDLKETPEGKTARLAEEEAERALDDEALSMSLMEHKSWFEQNALEAGSPTPFSKTATNFDSSNRIWDRGGAPVQFSKRFDDFSQDWVKRLTKLVGLDRENMLFMTADDIERALLRPEFKNPEFQAYLKQMKENLSTNATGQILDYTIKGQRHSIVVMKQMPTKIEHYISTAHEVGHALQKNLLSSPISKPKAVQVAKHFEEWLAKRTEALGADEQALMQELISRVGPATDKTNLFLTLNSWGKMNGATKEWLKLTDEYFAEQFSKWAMTDARAIHAGEQVFRTWGQQLRQYMRGVVSAIQETFGKGAVKGTPDQMFNEMMNEHLARLDAERRFEGALPSLDFTGTEIGMLASDIGPTAAKPRIKLKSASPRYLVKQTVDDPLAVSGSFDPTDIDGMPWVAADPRHGVSVDAMAGRVVGVHQTAKMTRDLTKYIEPSLSKLSKKQRQRVLAVLEEGDQYSSAGAYGREFSGAELFAKDLTEAEVEAYMAIRQSRMMNYFIHNKELTNSARRAGLQEVELYGKGKLLGKALSETEAHAAHGKQMVYDLETKGFVELDAAKTYASGKRVIKTPDSFVVDGQSVSAVIAGEKEATVRTLHSTIHYRPGEFARIYGDNYFIRMNSRKLVDGVMKDVEYPIRTAATEKEAKGFIEAVAKGRQMVKDGTHPSELEKVVGQFFDPEQFTEMVVTGELKDATNMRFHFTRQIDDYLGQTLESHAHSGKLFTKDRGEHILTADRTRAARSNMLNPYEALSREISMVSNFANVTEWKEAQIGKWMNTFGDMLGSARTGNDLQDFFKVAGAKFSHVTGKRGLFAERTHKYILRQVGIQTDEHHWWQSLMRRMGEKSMPIVGEGVGAVIRDMNPLNLVRALNHHATLGMFNISQLIVQANGMAIAAAIHPIYGAKSAAMYPGLRLALMSDNPEVWARISKVLGEDVGKMAQMVRKTGLIDNLRTTSLHNIEDGKLDIFASYPSRVVKGVVNKGAFFFNRGEEMSRVLGLDIARREWQAANKGKDYLADEAVQWIMSRADDYTQNMTRANLSRWQEGILSIPTQFLQYNIKLAQNITSGLVSGGGKGRGFTRSESLKALAGSIAFYGTAGMGISNLVGEWIPDDVEAKMDPLTKTTISQGMVAGLFKAIGEAVTGERFDLALGQRMGTMNFFVDMVYDAFNDPKNIWEAMLGPSRSTGQRIAMVADVVDLWRRTPEVTLDDVGRGAMDIFAEQISSTRNVTKAYYIAQGNNVLRNRKGQPIAELSTPEIWAQAVGLAPSAAYDAYQMIGSRKQHMDALSEIADRVFQVQKQIMQARAEKNEDRVKRLEGALQLLWPQNMGDYTHVRRLIRERLFPFDTQFQKLLADHALRGSNFAKPFMSTTPDPE